MKVIVIIPAYNAAPFLSAAIASIQAQQWSPIEIIVVDDGSTDGTAAVAAHFGNAIRYFQQENAGPAAARNKGLSHAYGDVIAFLDADDLWAPGSLITSLAYLKADPNRQAVMGRVQLMRANSDGELEPYRDPGYMTSLAACVFKKEVFHQIGTLDTTLRQGEDVDWFLRARAAGVDIQKIEATTLYYRLHQSNITRAREENRRYFLTALKRSVDRRKALARSPVGP